MTWRIITLISILGPLGGLAQEDSTQMMVVDSLLALAYNVSEHEPYRAIAIGHEALRLADSIDYQKKVRTSYSTLGLSYTDAGQYIEAEKYLKQAIDLRMLAEDYFGAAIDHNNLSVAYRQMGDYELAINASIRCLELLRDHTDDTPHPSFFISLGLAFNANKDYADAYRQYHLALQAAKDNEDYNNLPRAHHNLALLHYELGRYDTACWHLTQALPPVEEHEMYRSEAKIYDLLACIQLKEENFGDALFNFKRSLQLNETIAGTQHERFENHLGIARVHLALGQLDSVLTTLLQAQINLAQIDRIESREKLHRLYFQTYQQLGRREEAFQAFQLAEATEDSILSLEKEQSILLSRRQFAERGEQLAKQQTIIATQEAAAASARSRLLGTYLLITLLLGGLIALLLNQARLKKSRELSLERQQTGEIIIANNRRTRKSLSMKLHDHVARPLTHIKRLLEPLQEEIAYDDELERKLAHAISIADSTYAVSREISYELRPELIDWIDMVKLNLMSIENITTELQVQALDADDFSPEDGILISTIIGNILANVEQHAQAKQVAVTIQKEKNQLHIAVNDDGIGFNPTEDQGVGLSSIQHQVQELGGQVAVRSAPGEGTQVDIQIPLA